VLKNFPSRDFLLEKLGTIAGDLRMTQLDYYWIASGTVK